MKLLFILLLGLGFSQIEFTSHLIYDNIDSPFALMPIDLDNDGDLDIVSASYYDDTINWLENDGNENYEIHVISDNVDGPQAIYASDLDGDGDLDVVSGGYIFSEGAISWHENDGNQNFTKHIISTGYGCSKSVYAIDMDNDNDIDVVSALMCGNRIEWYENDGNGSFETHVITNSVNSPRNVYPSDLDGDGDIDVIYASNNDDTIAWSENDGNQNFVMHIISDNIDGSTEVVTCDLDGDGYTDIISTHWNSSNLYWHKNDGNQNFISTQITSLQSAHAIFVLDMDNDEDVDIIASSGDNLLYWFENYGDATFTQHSIANNVGTDIYATNMDGDGDIDIFSVNRSQDIIYWFENMEFSPIEGCTNSDAINYNPDATEDDGSCYDCAGVSNGDAVLDECEVCDGDSSSFEYFDITNIVALVDYILEDTWEHDNLHCLDISQDELLDIVDIVMMVQSILGS